MSDGLLDMTDMNGSSTQCAVWGVFVRGLALTFALSFYGFSRQLEAFCGARGYAPAFPSIKQMRADFPSLLQRIWLFPGVIHLAGSSPHSVGRWMMAVCWFGYVLLIRPMLAS